jgi:hypothetical protein
LSASVRQIIAKLDPQLPVYDLRPLDDASSRARGSGSPRLSRRHLPASRWSSLVGVYGVIAYAITRRPTSSACGWRSARARPGDRAGPARGRDPRRRGLLFGLACAAVAARLLQSQLFAVSPRTGPAIGASAAISAAIAACWLPARRTSAINPLDSLRAE